MSVNGAESAKDLRDGKLRRQAEPQPSSESGSNDIGDTTSRLNLLKLNSPHPGTKDQIGETKSPLKSTGNIPPLAAKAPFTPPGEHKLHQSFTFWSHQRGNYQQNFEIGLEEISSFSTGEGFWSIYSYLARPSQLKRGMDYMLFLKGVKPLWEHEANRNGGKWVMRVKKPLADRYWEEMLLAVIGNTFRLGEEICGIVISSRVSEYVISVWHAQSRVQKAINTIRDGIFRLFDIDDDKHILEYKRHGVSMKQAIDYMQSRERNNNDYYARKLKQLGSGGGGGGFRPNAISSPYGAAGPQSGFRGRDYGRDRDNNRPSRFAPKKYEPPSFRRNDRFAPRDDSHRNDRFTPRHGDEPTGGNRFTPRHGDDNTTSRFSRDDKNPGKYVPPRERYNPPRDRFSSREDRFAAGPSAQRNDRFASASDKKNEPSWRDKERSDKNESQRNETERTLESES